VNVPTQILEFNFKKKPKTLYLMQNFQER